MTFPTRIFARICVIVMMTTTIALPAHAATSGWLTASQMQAYMKRVDSSGGLPTAISCRVAKGTQGDVRFRVTSGANKRKKAWQWLWTDNANFRKANSAYSRAGFKLASQETIRAGRAKARFNCALWHR